MPTITLSGAPAQAGRQPKPGRGCWRTQDSTSRTGAGDWRSWSVAAPEETFGVAVNHGDSSAALAAHEYYVVNDIGVDDMVKIPAGGFSVVRLADPIT